MVIENYINQCTRYSLNIKIAEKYYAHNGYC